jgi:hypothetical protein
MLKIVKELNQIEQKDKSVEEAELQFNVQRDIEQEKERRETTTTANKEKDERDSFWVLYGGNIQIEIFP